MTNRRIRLETGPVFLRCALTFFVVRELFVWRWVGRIIRPGARLRMFLFWKWATPRSVLFALIFAALATFLLDLSVRLVLRPLVRHWHTPWTDGSAGLFHLAANEWVVDSLPSRRKTGWLWPAGTLVCTNLRLWFFPRAHDAEIWSRPLAAVREARLVPAPRVAWGYIAGWPDRLAVEDGADAPEVFAVADPDTVLSWFPAARTAEAPGTAASPLVTPIPPLRRSRHEGGCHAD
jgi:hypothetical protein